MVCGARGIIRRIMSPPEPLPIAATVKPSRVRYKVVLFTLVLAVITYVDRACMSMAGPFIQKDLGLTMKQMSWVFTVFPLAYALFEVPGGVLGDRWGSRRTLTRVVIWWSFFTAATGSVNGFVSLIIVQILFGAGEAGCFPNVARTFRTWLPADERMRA